MELMITCVLSFATGAFFAATVLAWISAHLIWRSAIARWNDRQRRTPMRRHHLRATLHTPERVRPNIETPLEEVAL